MGYELGFPKNLLLSLLLARSVLILSYFLAGGGGSRLSDKITQQRNFIGLTLF